MLISQNKIDFTTQRKILSIQKKILNLQIIFQNFMIKRILIVLLFLPVLPLNAQSIVIDGVIWVVGDKAILKSDVDAEKLNAKMSGVEMEGNPDCFVPEQIAVQKLFLHQSALDSISVSDAEVENILTQEINRQISAAGSTEKLEEYATKSLAEHKNEMREQIRNYILTQRTQHKIVGEQKISPSEVRKFFNSLKEDSIPTIPATVEVQIITIEPEITESDKEAIKNQLRDIAERVNNGTADFSTMARLYSEDTGTAMQGGDLGFFGRGMMEAEFSNAAFAMHETGKVSRVIETVYGYHIIQFLEKKGDRIHARHILMRPKVASDLKQATINKLDSITAEIRRNTISFEQMAVKYSSNKATRMNGGLMSNENNGSAKMEYQELPTEVAREAYSLNKGDVSNPFTMIDTRLGREVFAIIKIKDKLPSHKANLTDDYQEIKKFCENVKNESVIQNWIQNKINETYIYIAPEYRNCKFKFEGWVK
jgi:peptidyl-prolyl cis-trans isomerase SurA